MSEKKQVEMGDKHLDKIYFKGECMTDKGEAISKYDFRLGVLHYQKAMILILQNIREELKMQREKK